MSKHRRKKKPYIPRRTTIEQRYLPMNVTVIKFKDIKISGFATKNVLPGEAFPILVRASLTSDEREFHIYMEEIGNVLSGRAKEKDVLLSFDAFVGFVLILHKDGTADFHLGDIQMVVEILAKRDIKAGEAIYGNDIGDIRRIKYQNLVYSTTDKVFVCFKVGWKFGLFFDLADDRELDVDGMERDMGSLYKRLKYQALYEALANEAVVDRMTKAGWFPFIEVIGGDFDPLLKAYQMEFDIDNKEKTLIKKFNPERVSRIAERWWRNPILARHKVVLQAGLDAFSRGDYVSCIKNIMTEIEGVLVDVHLAEKGSIAKTKELLTHAVDKAIKKTSGETSLFFPSDFLEYLLKVAYADFDPNAPKEAGASRHTVGHGRADGELYTPARALQVILTLDQIAFYL